MGPWLEVEIMGTVSEFISILHIYQQIRSYYMFNRVVDVLLMCCGCVVE